MVAKVRDVLDRSGLIVGVVPEHRPEQMVGGVRQGDPRAPFEPAHVAAAPDDLRDSAEESRDVSAGPAVSASENATGPPGQPVSTDEKLDHRLLASWQPIVASVPSCPSHLAASGSMSARRTRASASTASGMPPRAAARQNAYAWLSAL